MGKEDEAILTDLHPEQREEYDRLNTEKKRIDLLGLRQEVG